MRPDVVLEDVGGPVVVEQPPAGGLLQGNHATGNRIPGDVKAAVTLVIAGEDLKVPVAIQILRFNGKGPALAGHDRLAPDRAALRIHVFPLPACWRTEHRDVVAVEEVGGDDLGNPISVEVGQRHIDFGAAGLQR